MSVLLAWAVKGVKKPAPACCEEPTVLELRPNCECCDKDLPPHADALICTYECTFCRSCGEGVLKGVCPNCGGNLVTRPIRPQAKLAKDPASTIRKLRPGGCAGASAS